MTYDWNWKTLREASEGFVYTEPQRRPPTLDEVSAGCLIRICTVLCRIESMIDERTKVGYAETAKSKQANLERWQAWMGAYISKLSELKGVSRYGAHRQKLIDALGDPDYENADSVTESTKKAAAWDWREHTAKDMGLKPGTKIYAAYEDAVERLKARVD